MSINSQLRHVLGSAWIDHWGQKVIDSLGLRWVRDVDLQQHIFLVDVYKGKPAEITIFTVSYTHLTLPTILRV